MLNLSEISTPEALSEADNEEPKVDDTDSLDFEERRKHKKHQDYVVRLKDEPQYKRAKNKFDTYLTKTQLRAIKFSENKKRW